jgi:hypothetical protein
VPPRLTIRPLCDKSTGVAGKQRWVLSRQIFRAKSLRAYR